MINMFLCSGNRIQRYSLLSELNNILDKQHMSMHIIECNSLLDILNHPDNYNYPSLFITDYCFTDKELDYAYKIKLANPSSIFIHIGIWTVHTNKVLFSPDYLLHNFSIDVLWDYIRRAYISLISDAEHFTYYKRPKYISTHLSFIMYFCSDRRRINIVSTNNSILDSFYCSLDDVETFLQNKDFNFIRTHKSYLVNEQYIAAYNSHKLLLVSGNTLNISNHYYYTSLHHLLNSRLTTPIHK